MRTSRRARRAALLALAATCVASTACDCGSHDRVEHTTETTPQPAAPPKPAVLTGRVKLAPGAPVPSYRLEDTERHVLEHTQRGAWPESCTPPKDADRQPVRVTTDGYLAGVMLAASEFSQPRRRPAQTHEVTIRDCRLTPPLVVAMQGDRLRIKTEVMFPFMPVYGPSTKVETLIPGQTRDYDLKDMRVLPVLCGFTAPCGRTDVVVLSHPVSAITDVEGRFRIDDFPASETITLNAWHPLFDESHVDLRVEPGETREVELVLTPRVTPEAAPGPGATSPTGATGLGATGAPKP